MTATEYIKKTKHTHSTNPAPPSLEEHSSQQNSIPYPLPPHYQKATPLDHSFFLMVTLQQYLATDYHLKGQKWEGEMAALVQFPSIVNRFTIKRSI